MRLLASLAFQSRTRKRGQESVLSWQQGAGLEQIPGFLNGEVRYLSLKKARPAEAQELFDAAEAAAKRRYATYIRKTKEDWSLGE